MKKKFNKGFTLTELLIVIGLIAILSGAAITIFNPIGQIQKSQDAKRKADLTQIKNALELYYQDIGRYPPSTVDYRISANSIPVSWGSVWTPYMPKVPADPTSTKKYIYYTPAAGNGQTYYLYANLDRGASDSQACTGGNDCPNVPVANACGSSSKCNFGLSSPNTTP